MSNIPDKCSRCGAPIDWEKGASSSKCSFCGKTNYLKSYFFNEFKNKLTFKNTKNILLNPISIFVIILLPVIFSRFIIQSNKYKRFDDTYLAKEACNKDLRKISGKTKENYYCWGPNQGKVLLIKNNSTKKVFKLSKKTKKNIQDFFLSSALYIGNSNTNSEEKKCNSQTEKKIKSESIRMLYPFYWSNENRIFGWLDHYSKDQIEYFSKKSGLVKNKEFFNHGFPNRTDSLCKAKNLYGIDCNSGSLSISSAQRVIWYLQEEIRKEMPEIKRLRITLDGLTESERSLLKSKLEYKKNINNDINWLNNFIENKREILSLEIKNDPKFRKIKLFHKADCIRNQLYSVLDKMEMLIKQSSAMKDCIKKNNQQTRLFLNKENYHDSTSECLHPLTKSRDKDDIVGGYSKPFIEKKNDFNQYLQDVILKSRELKIKKIYRYY